MMKYKYIDLFSGIGSFRQALDEKDFECVFSSENNSHAAETYKLNYDETPFGDINEIDASDIPDHDILFAGFPCQTFSASGKKRGFLDETKGTLFFNIIDILSVKKPDYFILENVKNLMNHDGGRTFDIMYQSLTSLGYSVDYKVLNSKDYGVPQNRERIFIIGNLKGKSFFWDKIETNEQKSMSYLIDTSNRNYINENEYTIISKSHWKRQKSDLIFCGYINKQIRKSGVKKNTEHLSRVHKQINRIYHIDGTHPTISSQESAGRFYIYDGVGVRKLTIQEIIKLFGFEKKFRIVGPNSKIINRLGNSIPVPMVMSVIQSFKKQLLDEGEIIKKEEKIIREIYIESLKENNYSHLEKDLKKHLDVLINHEATSKGVFTATVTSIYKKILDPSQDIRNHQISITGGYSARSFDTKYVTPFLKEKRFQGAMKESGWLTRSIEQPHPFDFDFPGKISNKSVKESFLWIINIIEKCPEESLPSLKYIFNQSYKNKEKNNITIFKEIDNQDSFLISDLISLLEKHFSFKYKTKSTSILPVVAFYSIYEILLEEIDRFKRCKMDDLNSHFSSDKNSGAFGDIDIKENGEVFESLEIKYDIPITKEIVDDVYLKLRRSNVKRYYILSTSDILYSDKDKINEILLKLREKHGCQLIINGLLPSLNYYLRLLKDINLFMSKYAANIEKNTEIQIEQKLKWNEILIKYNDEKREKKH